MDGEQLTVSEVAEQLGVHYMTAYRYVRLGSLPARKVGNRWQVRLEDVAAFRARQTAGRDGGPGRRNGRSPTVPWAERYEARALAGDLQGAWAVLQSAQAGGSSVTALYTDVISPALRSVGDQWSRGELDIADEHRASAVTTRVLARLAPQLVRPGRPRSTVVFGGAPGDRHGLPVTMVADLVSSRGWDVIDLGADVPPASFVHAANAVPRLGALGISVSAPGLEAEVRSLVEELHERFPDAPVALGGPALPDADAAARLGADLWAADGLELAERLDLALRRGGRRPASSPAPGGRV